MSQNALVVANGTGASVRAAINSALDTLATLNSGSSAPTGTSPYMLWMDTGATPQTIRMRNSVNGAWIKLGNGASPYMGLVALNDTNAMLGGQVLECFGVNLASGTTVTVGTDGNSFYLTGNNTVQAFSTTQAGSTFKLVATGTPTLKYNSTTMILNGAADFVMAANYTVTLMSLGSGNYIEIARSTLSASASATNPRAYLAGLELSNTGASPNYGITIAVGTCRDSGNANDITQAAQLTKYINTPWVVGDGLGGRQGASSSSTWWHMHAILRTDTSVVDAYFDTSITAANIPASYTKYRRLGSVYTDGFGKITQFVQKGEYFRWLASVLDVNTNNPGTSGVTATLSVPTGLKVHALFNAVIAGDHDQLFLASDIAANPETPSTTAAPGYQVTPAPSGTGTTGVSQAGGPLRICTNTSAQIRYQMSASSGACTVRLSTFGWLDPRGRDD